MGYFFALDIPDRLAESLPNAFDISMIDGVRVQRRADLHITLSYIPNIPAEVLGPLEKAITQTIKHSDFDLQVQGCCYFPPQDGYSTHFFCAEIIKTDEVVALKSKIDAVCRDIGLNVARVEHEYHPHITLGRMHADKSVPNAVEFEGANVCVSLPKFHVDHFSLYKSHHPDPYKKLYETPLQKQ